MILGLVTKMMQTKKQRTWKMQGVYYCPLTIKKGPSSILRLQLKLLVISIVTSPQFHLLVNEVHK